MKTRLTLRIDIKDWTEHGLREAVRGIDAVASGTFDEAIALEKVTVLDVLTVLTNGDLGVDYEVIDSGFEEM
jgi:hypothetical protein